MKDYTERWSSALEEANRYIRYLENFFWIISSFWMVATGFAISKALEWGGKNEKVVYLGIGIIFGWILYLLYWKNIRFNAMHYFKIANEYEKKLGVDILPPVPIGETNWRHKFWENGLAFSWIMLVIACSAILLGILFIYEFVIASNNRIIFIFAKKILIIVL